MIPIVLAVTLALWTQDAPAPMRHTRPAVVLAAACATGLPFAIGSPFATATNVSHKTIVFEWTMYATPDKYGQSYRWSDVGILYPGASALWLMPTQYLGLWVSYGDREDFVDIQCQGATP